MKKVVILVISVALLVSSTMAQGGPTIKVTATTSVGSTDYASNTNTVKMNKKGEVVIMWETTNATHCLGNWSTNYQPIAGLLTFAPTHDTVYAVMAYGENGQVAMATVTVKVKKHRIRKAVVTTLIIAGGIALINNLDGGCYGDDCSGVDSGIDTVINNTVINNNTSNTNTLHSLGTTGGVR